MECLCESDWVDECDTGVADDDNALDWLLDLSRKQLLPTAEPVQAPMLGMKCLSRGGMPGWSLGVGERAPFAPGGTNPCRLPSCLFCTVDSCSVCVYCIQQGEGRARESALGNNKWLPRRWQRCTLQPAAHRPAGVKQARERRCRFGSRVGGSKRSMAPRFASCPHAALACLSIPQTC